MAKNINFIESIFEFPYSAFKSHVDNEENSHIVFSGKFGAGKTSFLHDFFSKEEQLRKYNVFHLSPVNYSIASNGDILNYIKYDLIFEFLKKGINLSSEKLDLQGTFPLYVNKHYDKLLITLARLVPYIGKDLSEVLKGIIDLRKDVLKYQGEINMSDEDVLVEFLDKVEKAESSLYEIDLTTKVINKTLTQLAESRHKQVLIIDDLDRIDPEHIFRLFNVFSSSFNVESNKYTFDKIIFVCDLNNIANIFYNKYGKGVDFSGYIDKFYSFEIFYFDNRFAVRKTLNTYFNNVTIISNSSAESEIRFFKFLLFRDGYVNDFVSLLIDRGYLSLRGVLRSSNISIIPYAELSLSDETTFMVYKSKAILILKFLSDLFGGYEYFKRVLQSLIEKEEPFESNNDCLGLFVILISKGYISTNQIEEYVYAFNDTRIRVKPFRDNENNIVNGAKVEVMERIQRFSTFGNTFEPKEYWQIVLSALELLKRKNYLY